MRQHVNPLGRFFQLPVELPKTAEMFENESLPIHLDIGSARGKFLLDLAPLNDEWNFLGVEIRQPLVVAAEKERMELGLNNLKFIFCNANVNLGDWLSYLNANELQRVSIQFPDPWFKRRHFKRRVLQPELLTSIANKLKAGSDFFIQSDILEVMESMIEIIDESNCFERKVIRGSIWLDSNPYDLLTERELYVIKKRLPIYRALYYRK